MSEIHHAHISLDPPRPSGPISRENTTNPTPPIQNKCNACSKEQTDEGMPLMKCGACHTTPYCSKDCQKADWKAHKTTCSGRHQNTNPKPANPTDPFPGAAQSAKASMESLLGINTKAWLHDMPKAEVYTKLIDSYRMRVEDEYVYAQFIDDDSLYGQGDPTIGFKKFLQTAEKRADVLPTWWNAEERQKCISKGDEKEEWSSLHFALEKHDVQEHYGDGMMPMRLRMLAEEITGSNVMSDGATAWHK